MALEVDGDVRGVSRRSADLRAAVAGDLAQSITKAAKLASKVTVLTAPLLDPDGRHAAEGRGLVGGRGDWRSERFDPYGALASQEALGVAADRRLIVDAGHDDITALTAKVRDLAEVYARDRFFDDREAAIAALQQQRDGEAGEGERGFVRAEDDRSDVRLQVADVAAGWARTLLAGGGYHALVVTFRCVLHNGRPLDRDGAVTLDRQIAEHRALVAAYLARGAGC